MKREYHDEEKFENLNFQNNGLVLGDYENCSFVNCDFSNSDMSGMNFLECKFTQCNLTLTKLTDTSLKDVMFENCKLIGLHFDDCNQLMFSVSFDSCSIDICSFFKMKMKNTKFINSRISESDFEEADLSYSSFQNCDLAKSAFSHTNLEKADLRSSYNYSIDPESNNITKTKFSFNAIKGLLDKYDIEIEN